MKKLVMLFTVATLSISAFAQKSNRESAALYLNQGELADAKMYIDKATVHPDTKEDLKTWYYCGRIYLLIFSDTAKAGIDPDAVEKSTLAFLKTAELDKKNSLREQDDGTGWEFGMVYCALYCYNKAAEMYDKKDYAAAIKFYDYILKLIPYDNKGDIKRNNIIENQVILYKAYAAQQGKMNDVAIASYQQLVNKSYNDPTIYIQLELMYLEMKDTSNCLKYIELGRQMFPENKDLMSEELRIYEARNDLKGLMEKINNALANDPDNSKLLVNRGLMYQRQSDDLDRLLQSEKDKNKKKAMSRACDSLLNLAEADFQHILKNDPEDTLALYSLGAVYIAKSKPIVEEINGLNMKAPDYQKKYDATKGKLNAMYLKALEPLEKAHKLAPGDQDVIFGLFQLYTFLGRDKEAAEMNKLRKK